VFKEVTDGVPQYGELPAGSSNYVTYGYRAIDSTPISITLTQYSNNMELFITIVSSDLPRNQWNYPTSENHLLSSEDKLSTDSLYINEEDLKSCGHSCMVLVALRTEIGGGTDHKLASSYLLTITKGIQTLSEGSTIHASSEANVYNYYKFYKSCKKCEIAISINPASGGIEGMIMASFNVSHKMPTHEENDFKKQFHQNDVFEISPLDEYFQKRNIKDTRGMYIIGIHSVKSISYSIHVEQIKDKIRTAREHRHNTVYASQN
jgi:hypothetical protein